MMHEAKVNKYSILLFWVSVFLLTNLFRDILPDGTNQVTGGLVIVFVMWCIFPFRKKELLFLLFIFISSGIAIFTAEIVKNHMKYLIYFVLEVCILFMLQRDGNVTALLEVVKKKKTTFRCVTFIFAIILGLMLMSSQCYSTDLWGGAGYFQGFSVPHGVAGSCCLAIGIKIILLIIDSKYRYLYILEILLDCYAIVKSGTRTYLFSVVALLGLTIFAFVKKKSGRILLIMTGAICFGFFLLNSSSFQSKMQYALNYRNIAGFSFIDAFTSSRSIIWSRDIKYFFERSNFLQILFGGGFDYSYEINSTWTNRIQAHNGFLEVLMSLGLTGLILFLLQLWAFIKKNSGRNILFMAFLVIYIPIVIFFDDILQAPSYMMSFLYISMVLQLLYRNKREGTLI